MRCTTYKVAPDDGLVQSETCRAFNRKWSLITRILCILLVYLHIVWWRTVRTASNRVIRLIKFPHCYAGVSPFQCLNHFLCSQKKNCHKILDSAVHCKVVPHNSAETVLTRWPTLEILGCGSVATLHIGFFWLRCRIMNLWKTLYACCCVI